MRALLVCVLVLLSVGESTGHARTLTCNDQMSNKACKKWQHGCWETCASRVAKLMRRGMDAATARNSVGMRYEACRLCRNRGLARPVARGWCRPVWHNEACDSKGSCKTCGERVAELAPQMHNLKAWEAVGWYFPSSCKACLRYSDQKLLSEKCLAAWHNQACTSRGCSACGDRVNYLRTARRFSAKCALDSVALQFPSSCGACAVSDLTIPDRCKAVWKTRAVHPGQTCTHGCTCGERVAYLVQARRAPLKWALDHVALVFPQCGQCAADPLPEKCVDTWHTSACHGSNCFTCGQRVVWLVAQGFAKTTAVRSVAWGFPKECGACSASPVPETCLAQWENKACDRAGCSTCGNRVTGVMHTARKSGLAAATIVGNLFPLQCSGCAPSVPEIRRECKAVWAKPACFDLTDTCGQTCGSRILYEVQVNKRSVEAAMERVAQMYTKCAPCSKVVPASPGLHYTFDDGTATDVSGNGNHGTLNAGVSAFTKDGFEGLSFDGVGTVAITAMNIPGDQLTISAWVKLGKAGQVDIVSKASGAFALGTWAAGPNTRAVLRVMTESSTTPGEARSRANIPIGLWTHLAGTYDGQELRVYQNGVLVGQKDVTGALVEDSSLASLGPLTGEIDEVIVTGEVAATNEAFAVLMAGKLPPKQSCTDDRVDQVTYRHHDTCDNLFVSTFTSNTGTMNSGGFRPQGAPNLDHNSCWKITCPGTLTLSFTSLNLSPARDEALHITDATPNLTPIATLTGTAPTTVSSTNSVILRLTDDTVDASRFHLSWSCSCGN